MNRVKIVIFLLILTTYMSPAQAAEFPLSSHDRLLILAPHPDDDVLSCGGLIQRANQRQIPVNVVFLTNGDNNAWAFTRYHHYPTFRSKTMLIMGNRRHDEAVAAGQILGLRPDQLVFLGYPDYGMLTLWNDHWGNARPYQSRMTCVQAVPYATAFRPGAAYTADNVLRDLEKIIKDFGPTKIFVPDPADEQADHRACFLFTQKALASLAPSISPQIYSYLIHFRGWPRPKGLHQNQALNPPVTFPRKTSWVTFGLTPVEVERKFEAVKNHRTQWNYSHRFLKTYIRTNELFGNLNETLAH